MGKRPRYSCVAYPIASLPIVAAARSCRCGRYAWRFCVREPTSLQILLAGSADLPGCANCLSLSARGLCARGRRVGRSRLRLRMGRSISKRRRIKPYISEQIRIDQITYKSPEGDSVYLMVLIAYISNILFNPYTVPTCRVSLQLAAATADS
eukprot:COSAG05_NODE_16_length_35726_cov_813.577584_9_plen_152_part_00